GRTRGCGAGTAGTGAARRPAGAEEQPRGRRAVVGRCRPVRLHHLELSAFGPFPRTESVDFDALGADGLFLLHGHTGAGKTTLLDAISFALFGVVPGARGEAKRLRSDQAEPTTPTRVCLEFTVGSHRLRIERFPEYERPKKRGDGVTKQPAKASLTWVNDPPSGYSNEPVTRIDEV